MKKSILVIAMMMAAVAVFAQKLGTNPCDCKFWTAHNAPANWYIQCNPIEKANITYKELGDNKRIVRIAPQKHHILFYYGGAITSTKGDVINIKYTVKGTGKVNIGYISYGKNNSNNFSESKAVELTDKEQSGELSFEIRDNANGQKTQSIRLSISAYPGNVVELISYKAEMEE